MSNRAWRLSLVLCAAALVAAPAAARADSPVGKAFTLSFGGAHAIWDFGDFLSGCDSICEDLSSDQICLDSCFNNAIPIDARGRIQSVGTFDLDWSENGITLIDGGFETSVRGRASGNSRNGTTRLMLSMRLKGYLGIQDGALKVTSAATGSGRLRGEVDANGLFIGELSMRICLETGGCAQQRATPVAAYLTDGRWSLTFAPTDADERGRRFGGHASAEMADGSQFAYTIQGSYNDRSDSSTLTLRNADDSSRGSRFMLRKLETSNSFVEAGDAGYSMQGARGNRIPLGP